DRGARPGPHRRGGRPRDAVRGAVPPGEERAGRRSAPPAVPVPAGGGGLDPVLYPPLHLLGGRAVPLHRGERESAKVYAEDPAAQARAFVQEGAQALHVVDLDAAFGEPRQLRLIERIAQEAAPAPVQVGGGVRDLGAAEDTLAAGASRVV